MVKIGLIGCGAIGSSIAKTIEKKFSKVARLVYVSDQNPEQIEKLQSKIRTGKFHAVSIPELAIKSDLIIEAASQQAAKQAIPEALKRNRDIIVLSVGGLLQIPNFSRLLKKSRARVHVPSGAIAGIDAVLAAKALHIKRIQVTTRKPLKSLSGSPYFQKHRLELGKIRRPTLIFDGTAFQAIRCFPQNINVAATLSLAGIGARKTRVRIFASPTYHHNTHEIEIKGDFGLIVSKVRNVPSGENPKTSALAIGSTVALLEKMFERLKVGT
jgi:aspartate dehydrogenase